MYDESKSYGNDNYKSTEYPSYEKDNSYPSKDNSVILKKGKCNNINVNINGFNGVEVNAVPPALNGLATEAQADEGEVGASSLESGSGSDYRSSGHDSDSRIICINNNEFTVGEDGVTPVDDACNLCFADLKKAAPEVYTAIQRLIDAGIHIDGFDFEGGTVEQFCKALSDFVKESGAPLPVTLGDIKSVIGQLGIDSLEEAEALIDFIECLIKGGLIDINIADVEATLAALPSLAGALK